MLGILGVAVTVALSVGAEVNYQHDQRRLTSLQTRLTASALAAASVGFERLLGSVVGVVSNSDDPSQAFRRLMASSMKPSGPFAAASLIELKAGTPTLLVHLGVAPIRKATGPTATALYLKAARSSALVTTRAVGHGLQKLGYMMAATGSAGTFVVSGAQSLPARDIVSIAPNSPDSGLNIAIYFGSAANPSDLLASSTAHLPLSGAVSKAVVPLGTSSLTLVASPRTSLAGTLAAVLPWAIIGAGIAMTIIVALLVERLGRRKRHAEDLANQNDLLYREQRDVALTLQRALLPAALPSIAGVECAARYQAGGAGLDIGGDWYDIFSLDDGAVVFVIGDVSGRGVEAAAVMASLRFASRAFAYEGHPPEIILQRLSMMLGGEENGHFATVLCGRIDLHHRRLDLASAGHLPPVIVTDGQARTVRPGLMPPIGVAHHTAVEPTTTELPPRATLLAYTDGLVERRGEGLDRSIQRLEHAAVAEGRSLDDLLDHILEALTTGTPEDDVAILGLRWPN